MIQVGKELKAARGGNASARPQAHAGRAVRAGLCEFDHSSVAGGIAGVKQCLRHAVDACRQVLRTRRLYSRARRQNARHVLAEVL